MNDEMRQQCSQMTDEEIVRAITVEQSAYSAEFRQTAQFEISRRGFTLNDFVNRVQAGHQGSLETGTSIEGALALIPDDIQVWDAWFFVNCLSGSLFLQKEMMWITLQYRAENEPPESYFIKSDQMAKDVVNRFLTLDDWRLDLENEIRLENWPIIEESDSADYIRLVAGRLTDADVPSTVKSQGYHSCACGGGHLKIMVPVEAESDARDVIKALKKETEALYTLANDMDETTGQTEALSVYRQLAVLAPEDAQVFYNFGTLLHEAGQFEESADVLSHAAFLNPAEYHHVDNCLSYLKDIAEKLPDSEAVLHSIASLLMHQSADPEEIESVYQKIVVLNESDALAHVNLGHFYYQEGEDDRARHHFGRYLELEPQAEDREQIHVIMKELEGVN